MLVTGTALIKKYIHADFDVKCQKHLNMFSWRLLKQNIIFFAKKQAEEILT